MISLSFFLRSTAAERMNRARLLETVTKATGYRSQSNTSSFYGRQIGYESKPWSGAFIDVCFKEAGILIPSCSYPPVALAEFVTHDRFFNEPQLGDIIFLSVPAGINQMFSMPGIGVVTDLSRYKKTGQVGTIEGQTVAQDASTITSEGVYRRIRAFHEVIGYGRPDYTSTIPTEEPSDEGLEYVYMDRLGLMRRNTDVGVVQRALETCVGLRHNVVKDLYDGPTKDAYAHFQRLLGYNGADVTGVPDYPSLIALGNRSRSFWVRSD